MIKTGITNCFVERTTCFSTMNSGGTCFAYDYNGEQILLTARHIFKPNYPNKCEICIYNRITLKFEKIIVDIYYLEPNIDVAIMKLPLGMKITNETALPALAVGPIIWGEDVFILGFPECLGNNFMQSVNNTTRAFIKKAVLSGHINDILYLDGFNNNGFSGGPICYADLDKNEYLLIGIVSGYLPEISDIKNIKDVKSIGMVKAPSNKDICAITNSSIICGTSIKKILELLDNLN